MKRLTLLLIAGILIVGTLLSGCGAVGGPAKVLVATDATWPPFEYIDEETKEIIGFDIDLMKAIAARAGFEVEFVNVGWDPLLAGVSQCQYDAAISSVSITEDRKLTMAFSDPYFTVGQLITVRTDNTDISGKDDLVGKKVGAQLGTTGAIEVEKITGATLVTYDSIDLAFQDLLNGQIDAVVADNALAYGFIGKNSDKLMATGDVFTGEEIGIAVCKNNSDLLAKINAALSELKAEGLLEDLNVKWLQSQ